MTTDKAFKRVVRARMAKTGERYAAARRSLLASADPESPDTTDGRGDGAPGYRMRGGLHPETATLANVLANQGVVSGLTGRAAHRGGDPRHRRRPRRRLHPVGVQGQRRRRS